VRGGHETLATVACTVVFAATLHETIATVACTVVFAATLHETLATVACTVVFSATLHAVVHLVNGRDSRNLIFSELRC
jgi:hypothetical protein